MKLGIIGGSILEENSFKEVSDLGLSLMESCYNYDCDCDELYKKLPQITEWSRRYGVSIGAVGRWGADKFDEHGKVIAGELANSRTLIDVCESVGCPVFNTGVNYVEKFSLYDNIGLAIDYLSQLIEYARARGVKIATYNCRYNSFIASPDEWRLIHGHLPELGIKYDPSHAINGGRDYLLETARWADRFFHVHIKGTLNVAGEHLDDPPAGLDMTDWGAFMGLLYKHGYDGMLSIEPHSDTWRGELGQRGVRYTIEHISAMIF